MGDRKQETEDRRHETGSRRRETGDMRQDTRETGERSRETVLCTDGKNYCNFDTSMNLLMGTDFFVTECRHIQKI